MRLQRPLSIFVLIEVRRTVCSLTVSPHPASLNPVSSCCASVSPQRQTMAPYIAFPLLIAPCGLQIFHLRTEQCVMHSLSL